LFKADQALVELSNVGGREAPKEAKDALETIVNTADSALKDGVNPDKISKSFKDADKFNAELMTVYPNEANKVH